MDKKLIVEGKGKRLRDMVALTGSDPIVKNSTDEEDYVDGKLDIKNKSPVKSKEEVKPKLSLKNKLDISSEISQSPSKDMTVTEMKEPSKL